MEITAISRKDATTSNWSGGSTTEFLFILRKALIAREILPFG